MGRLNEEKKQKKKMLKLSSILGGEIIQCVSSICRKRKEKLFLQRIYESPCKEWAVKEAAKYGKV